MCMRVFKANKKEFAYLIVAYVILALVLVFLTGMEFSDSWVLIALLGLFLWMYFDSSYHIKEGELLYRLAFFRGQIAIGSIREITVGETLWVGMKPALARNGLVVKYNKFDEIYIAPLDNYDLVDALVAVNPEIKIVDKRKQPS